MAQVCTVWHALSVPCCIVSCSLILLSGLSSRSAIGVRGCLQPEDAVVVFVRSCGSVCNKQPLQFAHMLDIARRRVCTHLCQFFAHTCARACALASAHDSVYASAHVCPSSCCFACCRRAWFRGSDPPSSRAIVSVSTRGVHRRSPRGVREAPAGERARRTRNPVARRATPLCALCQEHENMRSRSPRAVLTWFATLVRQQDEVSGTPDYMAPEQMLQSRALITPQTNIYNLAAVLFYLARRSRTPPCTLPSTRRWTLSRRRRTLHWNWTIQAHCHMAHCMKTARIQGRCTPIRAQPSRSCRVSGCRYPPPQPRFAAQNIYAISLVTVEGVPRLGFPFYTF